MYVWWIYAIKTFGKPSKLPDSVGITNFNFWMACLGYWKVTTNFILDRWRIQIQRSVRHFSSSSSLRSFPICLLNKLFLLLLTLVTCIFTIWSWMASSWTYSIRFFLKIIKKVRCRASAAKRFLCIACTTKRTVWALQRGGHDRLLEVTNYVRTNNHFWLANQRGFSVATFANATNLFCLSKR